MPSSSEGRRYCTETGPSGAFSGSFHPAMWSYGMMPWQQPPVQAQPYPYPMHPVPYPVVMNPRMNSVTAPWFHANDNYTSLPPKPKLETEDLKPFAQVKPARRFSDPGPVENCDDSPSPVDDKPASDHEDELEPSETQLFAEEARKDKLFAYLLQELRTARNLNRHFCLELHKTKLQLHLIQQQPPVNENPPGSIAAMVRKVYEAHHVRNEVLSNWNKSEDPSYGRRSSYSNKYEAEDPENMLMKEREILMNRLQSTEKKIQYVRNSQWNGGGGGGGGVDNGVFYHKIAPELRPPINSRCFGDVLSSSKVSRSHSFALTSPSTSDPPSLDEDVEISSPKHHGGTCSVNSVSSNPLRLVHEGRSYSSNALATAPVPSATAASAASGTSAAAAAAAAGSAAADSLKRDLQLQLASVERDRRRLELQLQESLGTRRHSEDRVLKLERLVSVLRKKLESQTTAVSTSSANGLRACPSPIANEPSNNSSQQSNSNVVADYPDYVAYNPADGPASLPSYLHVVGPITQL